MEENIEQNEVPDGYCVLCRVEIQGHGNNPGPVWEIGKCCDNCSLLVVIPHRMRANGLDEDMVKEYFERILVEVNEAKHEKKVKDMHDRLKHGTRKPKDPRSPRDDYWGDKHNFYSTMMEERSKKRSYQK